jgi:hypothetical protein
MLTNRPLAQATVRHAPFGALLAVRRNRKTRAARRVLWTHRYTEEEL